MLPRTSVLFRKAAWISGTVTAAVLVLALSAHARVTRIVVDTVTTPAFGGQSSGSAGAYETIAGRAFGELDPRTTRTTQIITDIALATERRTARSSTSRPSSSSSRSTCRRRAA